MTDSKLQDIYGALDLLEQLDEARGAEAGLEPLLDRLEEEAEKLEARAQRRKKRRMQTA